MKIRIDQCPSYTAPDKAVAKSFISSDSCHLKNLSIAEIVIPPHTTVTPHYHKASEEVYQIIEGKVIMLLDHQQFEVQSGVAVPISTGQWHSIANESDNDLLMIVTCSPPWTEEDQYFERPEE